MNMIARFGKRGELWRQARVARELGSPFVAAILEAGHRQLGHAPLTADIIANWPHDPSAAALAMRFNAALHAIARRGDWPRLSALYRGEHGDFDQAIGEVLVSEDAFVATWMHVTPQTNEVGRAAAIAYALMSAYRRFGLPFELLELGSSCGLNLNLARYSYDLGGVSVGQPASPVKIAPDWRGTPPAYAPLTVLSAQGVDLNPLDASDDATRERLLSYVWADQPCRARRLEQAISIARQHPPRIDKGHAAMWLADKLKAPQQSGVCRVVFHSMVLQYLAAGDRHAIVNHISNAGQAASAERPLAWISFEWTPQRDEVRLSLTCWPSGETQLLARCHAYGNWIEPRPIEERG